MRAEAAEMNLAVVACQHYYLENRSKREIAELLRVSRFKVARLIAAARESGLVRIEIASPTGEDAELGVRVAGVLGLDRCVVVWGSTLGEAAAGVLRMRLRPGDSLGLGWGRAVREVVTALVKGLPHTPPVSVVQLSGGVRGVDFELNGASLAARAAQAMGCDLLPLHAPAFLENRRARDALVSEPSVRRTLQAAAQVAVAVVGVGAWQPVEESALARSGAISEKLLELVRRRGAAADVFGHLLDPSGRVIAALSRRAIAPDPDALRRIPLRLGVAAGPTKVAALRAVARSGLLNALVTDGPTALQLLDGDGRAA